MMPQDRLSCMEDPFWIRHVHPEFPDGPHYAIKEGFAKGIPFHTR
jgi:hypothetical protein